MGLESQSIVDQLGNSTKEFVGRQEPKQTIIGLFSTLSISSRSYCSITKLEYTLLSGFLRPSSESPSYLMRNSDRYLQIICPRPNQSWILLEHAARSNQV